MATTAAPVNVAIPPPANPENAQDAQQIPPGTPTDQATTPVPVPVADPTAVAAAAAAAAAAAYQQPIPGYPVQPGMPMQNPNLPAQPQQPAPAGSTSASLYVGDLGEYSTAAWVAVL